MAAATASWALFGLFWLFLAALALIEHRRPAIARPLGGARRIGTNVVLGLVGLLLMPLIPVSGIFVASWARDNGFGLFNLLGIGVGAAFLLTLLARSLAIYGFHRLSHRVGWMWRLHCIHHSDLALDISTAFRNHPGERLLVFVWMGGFCALFGLSPSGLLFYELVVPFVVAWSHANLRTPERFERWISLLLVTPAFHHIHHSSDRRFTDSHYSELFSLWDWVFGTAGSMAAETRSAMRIGLGDAYDPLAESLAGQLMLPLRMPATPMPQAWLAPDRASN